MGEVTFKLNTLKENNQSNPILANDNIYYADFINIKNRIRFTGYSEICNFVQTNIQSLLSSGVDKKPKILQIITDKDFLIGMDLIDINLSREYVIRFNRVYRAYVINPSKNTIFNNESANLMYKLVYKLNREYVNKLLDIGLSEYEAIWITTNRFSSTDERRNIRRTVRTIQHLSQDYMTEEIIVKIFDIFFGDQMTALFCAVMTDKFDTFDNKNEEYMYSTVSNALLSILTTMDVDDIKDILKEYIDELNKTGASGRFSLNTINPVDYKNITNAISELENMGMKVY
jgi:hypothetical protein